MPAAIQPERILRELAELWTNLAQPEHGPSTASGVLRACAMTLIVAAEDADDAIAAVDAVAELMHEHPSRAIVLRPSESGELEARVFAQCWTPFGSRQQICCEQIEITAAPGRLGDVPGLMLGLLAPDLPVVLWCRGARWLDEAHFNRLLALTDKLVVDSARLPGSAQALRRIGELMDGGQTVADLAWGRISGWRELIFHSFDTAAELERVSTFRTARVTYGDATPSAEALYLAAWIQRALPQLTITVDRAEGTPPPGIRSVTLDGMEWRAGEAGAVEVHDAGGTHPAVLPPSSDVQAMREELSITGRDSIYEQVHRIGRSLARA